MGIYVSSRERLDRTAVDGLHGYWIVWSGLLHDQHWALHSVINSDMNWL